jgi:hypothetical protein
MARMLSSVSKTNLAQIQRLLQTGDGFVVTLLFNVVLPEIGMGFDVVRLEIETMTNILIDFIPLLQFDVAQRTIDVVSGFFAILLQCLIVAMNRIVVFPLEKMFVACERNETSRGRSLPLRVSPFSLITSPFSAVIPRSNHYQPKVCIYK